MVLAGESGTTVKHINVDTNGSQIVVGAAATGSALVGNPVLVAGSDGTNARTIATDASGNVLTQPGLPTHATYVATVQGVAWTANTQAICIEAPSAAKVYLRRLIIWNTGTDTTNAIINFQLVRTTTAGTGGAITPAPMDTSDAAYGGIVRSTGTIGTLGTVLYNINLDVPNTASGVPLVNLDWDGARLGKGPIIPSGTANGIALWLPATAGGASFAASIEFMV